MKAQMHNFSTWVKETDPQMLLVHYKVKLEACKFEILHILEHHFQPQGYTCLFLLGESHLAIHTFPEEGESYIELSSCVKEQFNLFIKKP